MVAATTEMVASLERALGTWAQQSRGLWTQAGVRVAAVCRDVETERRRRAARVAALEAMLNAADQRERARIGAELAGARRSLLAAESALTRASAAEQAFTAARRRAGYALDPAIDSARADLRRRLQSLDAYASAGSMSAPAPAVPAAGTDFYATALSARGVQSVDLAEIDFSDNPILGDFGRGGVGLADYRWAAETWETVVRPGVAAGLSRDDFAERDGARDAPPLRRTANVYDMFLGDDPIRLSRRPDGTFDVIGGRHRIQVARQLGIGSLPARVMN